MTMRTKISKLCAVLLSCVLLVGSLTGCGRKNADNHVLVYYLNMSGTSLVANQYTPKSDDTNTEVGELLDRIKNPPESDDIISPVPQNLKVTGYDISDNGNVTVDFGSDYKDLKGYSEVLLRASVVRTLLQVKDISSVSFEVADAPLTDDAGNEIGPMTADTFLEYGSSDEDAMENTVLTLYYASSDGQHLVRETRRVYYNSNISVEKLVLEYLMEQPKTENALIPIPTETTILGVSVNDGTCYVNLDSTFFTTMDDVSQQVTIYAIVDSLCELPEVSQVQITVDGEKNIPLSNGKNLSSIYKPDLSLVEEES